jgi:hypothetical protein
MPLLVTTTPSHSMLHPNRTIHPSQPLSSLTLLYHGQHKTAITTYKINYLFDFEIFKKKKKNMFDFDKHANKLAFWSFLKKIHLNPSNSIRTTYFGD